MAISRAGIKKDDIKKLYKDYYSLKDKEVNVYQIPEMKFIATSGIGSRNIYTLNDEKPIWTMTRFINRVKYYTVRDLNANYGRVPLEMEWGDKKDTGTEFIAKKWVPHYIDEELYKITMQDLINRLGDIEYPPLLTIVPQRECAQILHIGPYSELDKTLEKLYHFLKERGYTVNGRHQEIFMNQPYCNPPEKIQILIRKDI